MAYRLLQCGVPLRHGHGSSFRNPTQPDPTHPLHVITTKMSQHKILQGPLAENVKSN